MARITLQIDAPTNPIKCLATASMYPLRNLTCHSVCFCSRGRRSSRYRCRANLLLGICRVEQPNPIARWSYMRHGGYTSLRTLKRYPGSLHTFCIRLCRLRFVQNQYIVSRCHSNYESHCHESRTRETRLQKQG